MMTRLWAILLLLLALAGCAGAQPASSGPIRDAGNAQAERSPLVVSATSTLAPPHSPTTPVAPASTSPGAAPTVVPSTPPATATPGAAPTVAPLLRPAVELRYSYPIGLPGRSPGDGFFIRHAYAVENTWFNPRHWHTGEDWYAVEGDAAGAEVYAIAAGEVVYLGGNYPGRVIIVRHDGDIYSMYGHLDPAVAVAVGQHVARGALLGTVLQRSDRVPNHLHFEVRTFLTTPEVNGAAPRYAFRCGVNCPPGPGYWPIAAPDHPGAQGWRNPTHVIARRMVPPDAPGPMGEVVVASPPISSSLTLWSAPPGADQPGADLGELALNQGDRFGLLAVAAGPEDERATSAEAYRLWYRIELPDGRSGWVQAAVAASFETGGDGRPASIYFNFLPV